MGNNLLISLAKL